MKPLYAIVTFHLSDGREIVDESMALMSISEREIKLLSEKRMPQDKSIIDFVTISMLYGNSSRLLFSVETKDIARSHVTNKLCYTFSAPESKRVRIGDFEMVIACQAYEKLHSMLKPRTGRTECNSQEIILYEE